MLSLLGACHASCPSVQPTRQNKSIRMRAVPKCAPEAPTTHTRPRLRSLFGTARIRTLHVGERRLSSWARAAQGPQGSIAVQAPGRSPVQSRFLSSLVFDGPAARFCPRVLLFRHAGCISEQVARQAPHEGRSSGQDLRRLRRRRPPCRTEEPASLPAADRPPGTDPSHVMWGRALQPAGSKPVIGRSETSISRWETRKSAPCPFLPHCP